MKEEPGITQIMASLVDLLKAAIERRVRAIENDILLVAVRRHFLPVSVDIPAAARRAPAAPSPCWRHPTTIDPEVRDSWLPIPRHVTFVVNGGLTGTIECRHDGKVSRFRFHSKSGAYIVLRVLAERGAITTTEKSALATRIQFYSLPEWADHEINREEAFGASFDRLRSSENDSPQDHLLTRGEVIKERQEWIT